MTTKNVKRAAKKTSAIKRAGVGQRRAITGEGVVRYWVYGLNPDYPFTSPLIIKALQQGLPFKELEELQVSLGMPRDKLADTLGISMSTLQRRKNVGRLDPAESDRVGRIARLMGRAITVFESPENARRWLNSPQHGLGGAVPLEYARTEVGAREVEDLLGRIEHRVYS